ncbi:Putative MnhG-like Na(+)/H(+) antiporter subunit G [Candidatus Trichorickettsia mobilis]|jgi:multicomponent Na+:H+ antiporter subunit G|uniref:MnhG-like Na(+)/H(+) antiporter subunit G n=1 Tax=Candidatus Trichorickettsia mobilis TaxID=1346319 RepID=A0ABZ0USP7_9RICK|nr:Na+/H+ antiporter subunit G [Candidatus Trichorickettsia mobilis]WPY00235.1 Putative MnhG-like Na(+)/H(+) antiporter subunit G [Candidatus Trichorickettsia mobilis]
MSTISTLIGWGLIIFSLFIIFSAIIGLFRFPDFYTKIHAAGLIDSCGLPSALIGLSCLQHNPLTSFKLILAAIAVLLLNPVATTALAKAALLAKSRLPELNNKN